jgi:hypothetical protein
VSEIRRGREIVACCCLWCKHHNRSNHTIDCFVQNFVNAEECAPRIPSKIDPYVLGSIDTSRFTQVPFRIGTLLVTILVFIVFLLMLRTLYKSYKFYFRSPPADSGTPASNTSSGGGSGGGGGGRHHSQLVVLSVLALAASGTALLNGQSGSFPYGSVWGRFQWARGLTARHATLPFELSDHNQIEITLSLPDSIELQLAIAGNTRLNLAADVRLPADIDVAMWCANDDDPSTLITTHGAAEHTTLPHIDYADRRSPLPRRCQQKCMAWNASEALPDVGSCRCAHHNRRDIYGVDCELDDSPITPTNPPYASIVSRAADQQQQALTHTHTHTHTHARASLPSSIDWGELLMPSTNVTQRETTRCQRNPECRLKGVLTDGECVCDEPYSGIDCNETADTPAMFRLPSGSTDPVAGFRVRASLAWLVNAR